MGREREAGVAGWKLMVKSPGIPEKLGLCPGKQMIKQVILATTWVKKGKASRPGGLETRAWKGQDPQAGTDGEKCFEEGPLVSDFRGIRQTRAGHEGGRWEVHGQMKTMN